MEVMEGCMATLQCQLSKKASVEWKKGPEPLRDGDRYRLRQTGTMCELQIHDLTMADAGEYSCMCGEDKTTAMLTIKGIKTCVVVPKSACHLPIAAGDSFLLPGCVTQKIRASAATSPLLCAVWDLCCWIPCLLFCHALNPEVL